MPRFEPTQNKTSKYHHSNTFDKRIRQPTLAQLGVYYTNTVGYQQIVIPPGFSVFTPTFTKVAGVTKNTLDDIKVLNADGVEFDGVRYQDTILDRLHRCLGKVSVNKVYSAVDDERGVDAGDMMPSMSWTTGSGMAKWGDNKDVELFNGEGIIVNNELKTNVIFQIAGEVALDPVINVPTGFSVLGNFTPVPMTLEDIEVLNANFEEFDGVRYQDAVLDRLHRCLGKVSVNKVYSAADTERGVDAGDMMPSMSWTTGSSMAKWGDNATVPLAAGEALVVNNELKTNVFFRLKRPIANK